VTVSVISSARSYGFSAAFIAGRAEAVVTGIQDSEQQIASAANAAAL
jgi:hypothetical protein